MMQPLQNPPFCSSTHGSFSCGSGAVRVNRTAEGSGPISVMTRGLWIMDLWDTKGAYRVHYKLAYVD
jgi:hypothetical protein